MSLLSDGESDQEVLKEAVGKVYGDQIPETSGFILKIKDED